jgi:hypothetical protein
MMDPTQQQQRQRREVSNINDTNDGELSDIDIAENNTDASLQQQQQLQLHAARRFSVWIALLAANIVSTLALAFGRRKHTSSEAWATWILSLSFVFSAIGVLCYLFFRAVFLSGPYESFVGGTLFVLWCIGLPIIMNPSNSIAVGYTQIVNANLYLGSWACFASIFWIVGDLLEGMYGFNVVTGFVKPHWQTRQGKWYAMVASSVVVLAASIRVFKSFECDLQVMKSAPSCIDSKYAISAAVVGTIVALISTVSGFMVSYAARIFEYLMAGIMVIIWCMGLGFVTFGEGPVSRIETQERT